MTVKRTTIQTFISYICLDAKSIYSMTEKKILLILFYFYQ